MGKASRKSSLSISAFMPCLNEALNLPKGVRDLHLALKAVCNDFEIIIINDGSTDNTQAVAEKLQLVDPQHIRIVRHPYNLGYGACLRTGFSAATKEWIFLIDGDCQFKPEEIVNFVPYLPTYKVVLGYRTIRAEGWLRAFNARLFKMYIDILFRLHVKDIDCAFKLLKRDLVQSLTLESTGAFTSAELLYRLKKKRVAFQQLPVTHLPRIHGTPTGNSPKVVIKAGWEALRLYLKIKFGFGTYSTALP